MNIKSVLEDSPAVVVGGGYISLHGRLAILHCGWKERIIAPVIAYSRMGGTTLSDRDFVVSKYILTELECDEKKIDIEFFEDGLFVYGTLLPRYITPEGTIHSEWGGLSNYPWVRTLVSGFELIYNGLPYAVQSKHKNVVGATYIGIPKPLESRIDDIELGAGYKKIETEGFILENYPIIPRLRIRMYMHHRVSGMSLPTMLYGELFVSKGEMFWFQRKGYFDVLEGNHGLLITAPHGGYLRPLDMKEKSESIADENTYDLARMIGEKIYELSAKNIVPNILLARIHRSIIDLNRHYYLSNPIAQEYHMEIRKIARKYRKVLLIDIHGMAEREGRNIEIGTIYGKTVHGDMEIPESIRKTLIGHGFKVAIDRELIGGFTVSEHGKNQNVYAVQIEVDRNNRKRKNLEKTAMAIAKSILYVYNQISNTAPIEESNREHLGRIEKVVDLEI